MEYEDTARGPNIPLAVVYPWQRFVKNVKKECGVFAITLNTVFEVRSATCLAVF
jgi:hypothetical protein